MAYTILSESYGRRLPKITATADSTDDLAALGVEFAEGSTVNVGGTTYSLDKVNGWVVPGSGGGGGTFFVELTYDSDTDKYTTQATYAEVAAAFEAKQPVAILDRGIIPAAITKIVTAETTFYRVGAISIEEFLEGDDGTYTVNSANFICIFLDGEEPRVSLVYGGFKVTPDD